MEREIFSDLLAWKSNETHKPLIVRGARQVGKTYSIEEFGRTQFKHFIKLDFEKDRGLASIFDGALSPEKLFDRILIEKGLEYPLEDTLLFFDEIQLCPRAIMALRYFYEDAPRSWVIAAGSLLEFSLKEGSFPVGRVEYLWMYPMTFREFLKAIGQRKLCKAIPNIECTEPLDDFSHHKLLEYMKTYFIVGGMPEAVKQYKKERRISSIKKIHRELCVSFVDDFAKYNPRANRHLLETVFNVFSLQIGKHLKYTNLVKGKRVESIKDVCGILEKALIVHKIFASSGAQPLRSSSSERIFKGLFFDIGLMQYQNGASYANILDASDVNNILGGALAEQFVGQQLIARQGEKPNLFFWNRFKKNSQAEVDYLITTENGVVPIEVKSGPSGSLKSIHMFLEAFSDVSEGIVLGSQNISRIPKQRLKFMPLYTEI